MIITFKHVIGFIMSLRYPRRKAALTLLITAFTTLDYSLYYIQIFETIYFTQILWRRCLLHSLQKL